MQLRAIPGTVMPGLTGAISGAAGAAQGFLAAEEIHRKRQMQDEELQLAQRRMSLAEQRQEQVLERFMQQREMASQKAQREQTGQDAAGDAFGAMRRTLFGKQTPTDPKALGDVPQEFEQAAGAIEEAIRSGGMSPSEGAQAYKLLGTQYDAAATKLQSNNVLRQIQDEVNRGDWDPANALGIEIDVDGDGQPDPISDTPSLLMQALHDGVDPEIVAAEHARAKRAIDGEKARMIRRESIAAEAEQMLGQLGNQLPPEAFTASMERLGAWRRDEYPPTSQGEADFKMDFQQAQLGNLPLQTKGGVKVYVPRDQYLEAEHKLKGGGDPELERATDILKALSPLLGKFEDQSLDSDEKNNKRFNQYMERASKMADWFGLTPKQRNETAPSRSSVLTSGKPAGKASAGPTQPPSADPSTTPPADVPAADGAAQDDIPPGYTRPPPLTDQATGGAPAQASTPAARFQEILGQRDYSTLSVKEKADIARQLRAEFGGEANRPGKIEKPKTQEKPAPGKLELKKRGEQ